MRTPDGQHAWEMWVSWLGSLLSAAIIEKPHIAIDIILRLRNPLIHAIRFKEPAFENKNTHFK